jgi:archaellum component FlaC
MKLALSLLAASTVFGKQKFFKRLDNFIGNVNTELNNASKFIEEVKPQFETIQNTIDNVDL